MGFALDMSIIIYAEHCEFLEKENKKLREELALLQQLLDIKTFGLPLTDQGEDSMIYKD